jgi:hypothetical protein
MAPLKCPNSVCDFLFDPSKVPAGAVLQCPRCGRRFSLAQSAAVPEFSQVSRDAAESIPRGRGLASYVVPVAVGIVAVVGIVAAVLLSGGKPKPGRTDVITSDTLNFSFTPPGPPWLPDEEMKTNRLGVNVAAFRRSDPDAWVAMAAKDFGGRNPRKIELDLFLDDRLRRVFDNLKLEDKGEATWAGRPAYRSEFRATAKGTDIVVVGECYALGHKGVGYWFFAWAPQAAVATVHEEFDPIRERLTFRSDRDKWVEAKPKQNVLAGETGYSLTDREGIWAKSTRLDPKDEDPKADLVAEAVDPIKGPAADGNPTARLVVFLIDPDTDPLATARKYVEARHNRDPETFGPVAFEELTDEPKGDPPPGGMTGETKTIRLRLTRPNSPSSTKLLVVAGVPVGGKVAAVELSCPWNERSIWEKRLVALAGTLAAK